VSRVSHLLTTSVDWKRPTEIADGYGGQTVIPQDMGSRIVRISQPVAVTEEQSTGRFQAATQAYNIYDEPDSPVQRSDELWHINESGYVDKYRVIGLVRPSVTDVYVRFYCELYQTEPQETAES
jgi:hypothetical protein